MTVKELKQALEAYDDNDEVLSIEVEDWQWQAKNKSYVLECETLKTDYENAYMLLIKK